MFKFFFPSTARRLVDLEKIVAVRAHDLKIAIEKIEELSAKVERLEGEIAGLDDEIDSKVEREVEKMIDGLEVEIKTATRWR